ncbi:MAG TPA: cytochrome c-type biogenesis protein CcmH [Solirubrobacteraceae bacterium]|nr:cytochrome c-type biogenesis protein CcmH [Solirubrobacteraceae bacterium]
MRALAVLLALALAAGSTGAASAAAAARARSSLPEIEKEVMCPVCGTSLNIAQSPQAERERAFIRSLIARGETKAQIKRALVAQFGPAVLATPRHSGFSLSAYLVPIAAALAGLIGVGVAAVRWRRRGLAAAQAPDPALEGGDLDPADARRLERDLAAHDL